jgi:hypothetical protein
VECAGRSFDHLSGIEALVGRAFLFLKAGPNCIHALLFECSGGAVRNLIENLDERGSIPKLRKTLAEFAKANILLLVQIAKFRAYQSKNASNFLYAFTSFVDRFVTPAAGGSSQELGSRIDLL